MEEALAPVTETKVMHLSESEFDLLLKTLAFLATACTDIEIKNSEVHNRTDDNVVTYVMKLPFSENIDLTLANIANFVKMMKTFSGQPVEIEENERGYVIKFVNDDVRFVYTKPHSVNNWYNRHKVDPILKTLQFEQIDISPELLNKIRQLANKFGSDVTVNLVDGRIRLKSRDKQVTFEKEINVDNLNNKFIFNILQHALPSIPFVEQASIHVAKFVPPNAISTEDFNVFYKIETMVEINKSLIPFTVYGLAQPMMSEDE